MGILSDDNDKEALKEAPFKSKRRTEEIAARYNPAEDINDRIRTIFLKTAPKEAANTSTIHANDSGNKDLNDIQSNPDNSKPQNWGKSTTAGGGENPQQVQQGKNYIAQKAQMRNPRKK